VLTDEGEVMSWEDLQASRIARRHKKAFGKLCSNLHVPEVKGRTNREGSTFVAPDPLLPNSWIWEYKLDGDEIRDKWSQGQLLGDPIHVFQLFSGRLMSCQEQTRPDGKVQRVLIGKTKGSSKDKSLFLVGTLDSEQGEADRHCWEDGRPIFESSTGHLRKLIAKAPLEEHASLQKWRRDIPGVPAGPAIWRAVWHLYRSDKVNQFFWQVVYRIPASKYYVISRKWIPELGEDEPVEIVSRDDPRMWCERCPLNECEDLLHLLWKCPESQAIWDWVFTLMRKVCHFWATDWAFTVAQVLLGGPVGNGGSRWPIILWEII
jgi:hypothetical protein